MLINNAVENAIGFSRIQWLSLTGKMGMVNLKAVYVKFSQVCPPICPPICPPAHPPAHLKFEYFQKLAKFPLELSPTSELRIILQWHMIHHQVLSTVDR